MSTTLTDGWEQPRTIQTKHGPRTIRTKILSEGAGEWAAWRHDKELVKRLRFSIGKEYQGTRWQITHWESQEGQFMADLSGLDQILAKCREDEAASAEAMKIDYVAEDYDPLRTHASSLLFPWQKPSCQRVIAALKKGNAIDASQTGSGKTFIALAACAELGLTPFVIAPLAVLESWRRAAAYIGVALGDVSNYDKARCGSCKFIEQNKQANLHKHERMFAFAPRQSTGLFDVAGSGDFKPILILDECQKLKSGNESLQGRMGADVALQGAKVLYLSATAAKDPTEMYSVGLGLGLHEGGPSFNEWARRHGCRGTGRSLQFTKNPRAAADIMLRIHRQLFPAKGTRIRAADVPGYPENHITAQLVSDKSIVSAYHELDLALDQIDERRASGQLNAGDAAACSLAAIMKARRASEKGKLEWMIDEAREMVADGFQVVLFLNFREHLAIARDELKLKCDPIWGTAWVGRKLQTKEYGGYSQEVMVDVNGAAQKPADRQRIIDDFQAGKNKVCLVSLAAGGAGISLHDVNGRAPRQSIISPSYSVIDLVQAAGRIWRAGSHSKATQRIIFAAGTIEEEVASSIQAKCHSLEHLNDGALMPDSIARVLKTVTNEGEL